MNSKGDHEMGTDWTPEKLEALLRGLPRPQPPSGLEARLLARIPAPRQVDGPRGGLMRRRWWVTAASVAAAAIVILAVVWRQSPRPGRLEEPPPSVSIAQIKERIEAEAGAARLLAACRILERQPLGPKEALDLRQYTLRQYADTQVVRAEIAGGSQSAP